MVIVAITSCDKYLDVKPSKNSSLVVSTTEHLDNLLNSYGSFGAENNHEIIFGTDDYALDPNLYDAKNSVYGAEAAMFATWDVEYTPNYDRHYWPGEWKKIFTANLILINLDKVEGTETEKALLKAEAHFIRAYSYFKLANTYCLPYTDANKSELGLPIKQSTSFEEPAERVSLEETWNFIKADLDEALNLNVGLGRANDKDRTWRANKAAVFGFAARYYLMMNDYAKAEEYADKALAEHNYLRDYNTQMRFSDIITEETIFPVGGDPVNVEIKFPYTHDSQIDPTDMMEWGESYYYRYLNNIWWWYIPSQDLLSLYDQDYDLRYKYHIVDNYSYSRGLVDPPYEYAGYIFFFKDKILNGPSVPEMILTKAECQVRQGSFNEGLTTVNTLRAVRMDAAAPTEVINLSATSQDEALTKVLEERRRELPFTTRWFDIRRFNNNTNSADDVVMTRMFYPYNANAVLGGEPLVTYTLEKNSRKFAFPIPNTEIISSEGAIKQNTY